MLIAQILMFAAQPAAPVRPLPPPPPPAAEHHYSPGSRTVHTTYTCMDGARSVALQYGQVPKVDEVNRLIERFAQVAGVYPQCGRRDDSLFVSEVLGTRKMIMWIAWTEDVVHLVAVTPERAAR